MTRLHASRVSRPALARLLALTLCATTLAACAPAVTSGVARAEDLELRFIYGSEKEKWITEVTKIFNEGPGHQVGGKRVVVKAFPMGSGEAIDEVISGKNKAHLISPASGAFIELGNAESRSKAGGKDLIGETRNLVLSPVVIAMWKPMAEALGWPGKPIGWDDILKLVRDPEKKGWGALDRPEWGSFKFGHTHPEFSNSGLISVLAETYAGAGKTKDLTVEDVTKPDTIKFVHDIERAVVHYGKSTGFFANSMFANGPQALSATVLYESSVIESYDRKKHPKNDVFPVVAIYPKEGTFWSDHPVGIVEREWVLPEHRAAAKDYIDFLMAAPQQVLAMKSGFRPADEQIPLAAPLDADHGVDPAQPKVILPVPSDDVMKAILAMWRQNKKHSQVVLVLDTSGSMRANSKMVNAQRGALEYVGMLGDEDRLSLLLFSDKPVWVAKEKPVKEGRDRAKEAIQGIVPGGETAMYDALKLAHEHLRDNAVEETIRAIVVLSDGLDTRSDTKLPQLLEMVQVDNERQTTRIYTIYYGTDANKKDMDELSKRTRAESYEGTPANILKVFKDIATNQ